jgi:AcrR family transcriptional regulator
MSSEAAVMSKSALRRQRERNERLRIILAAAEDFFYREGYHKTSMERIADEAEVSVGSLYIYFKNKEDLLVHLLDQFGFELRELLGKTFSEEGVGFDGLRRASRAFFVDFCHDSPARLAIIFRESVGQSEAVENHRKHLFEKLIDDLESALERIAANEGVSFRSRESKRVMAASILGMYERLAYHYLIWAESGDDREQLALVAEDAVEFIIGGIGALAR